MTSGTPLFANDAFINDSSELPLSEESKDQQITPQLLQGFAQLIVERTGLEILAADSATVCEKIWERTKATHQRFPSQYYQLLANSEAESSTNQLSSEAEWPRLIALLTNSESYFFRDRGQISVLKHHILPELIMRKFAEKKLVICSAGCSRGEEPYSLAILLSELIPNIEEWEITVLGLDINAESIAYAEAGRYRQWSLRGVSPQQRSLYFRQQKQHYCIAPKFHSMVTFHPLNLVSDPFPNDMNGVDLILCRNVFIYFDAAAIATVINKFYQALQPQGYLLTGHAELYGQDMQPFQIRSFPGSLIFQRPAADAQKTMLPMAKGATSSLDKTAVASQDIAEDALKESAVKTEHTRAENFLHQAYLAFHNQNFELATRQLEAALAKQPQHPEALCLLAKVHFTAGQFRLATNACNRALEKFSSIEQTNKEHLEPHYILAKIAIEQGEFSVAKRILRKIIYLDPNAIAAHLELSQLYQQTGNLKKSDRLRQLAFELFRQQRSPTANGASTSPIPHSPFPI
ncbi:MAG: CheR family methyltransferase [Cyanobacteria bacterium J06649_4]